MKQLHRLSVSALVLASCLSTWADVPEPLFFHDFDSAADKSGKYTGILQNGANISKLGDESVLDLGKDGGYFDFGQNFGEVIQSLSGDFTISLTLFIPESTKLGANGNFVFNFGHSSDKGYAFFGANQSRYSITPTSWTSEQTVSADKAFPKGYWANLSIVEKGNQASIYVDGQLLKTSTVEMHPADLGKTVQNWLGKSPYNGDVMFTGAQYANFRIFDKALTAEQIAELSKNDTLDALNDKIFEQQLDDAVASMNFDFSDVRHNLNLPTSLGNSITVAWKSSDTKFITDDGKVTRPATGESPAQLTMTATVTKGAKSKVFSYPATVIPFPSDAEATAYDLEHIQLKGNLSNLRTDLNLPHSTVEGSKITWSTSDDSFLTATGRLMRLSDKGNKKSITLTATATRNGVSAKRDFEVKVAEPEDYDSYLFAFFPSNSDENLYYALSRDGYNYTVLNGGKRVLNSEEISLKKGIRDPHIIRGVDGKTFYMVATDMKCAEGWDSNRGMVLLKSNDLVNWTHSTIHFPDRFPEWKNVTRVWAPEVIWDPDYENTDGTKGRYMVYYSLLTNDGKCPYDKIFYSYANDDFTDLITEPTYFYDRGSATIDGDIIYDESTGIYHLFYKNEGSGGICKVTANRLTAEPGKPLGSQWSNPSRSLQQTNEAVEGAGMFRMINSDTWVLMYDCYNNGHYQFCSSTDLENFTLQAQTTTSGAFTPRHGSVMPLTPEETARLLEAFPSTIKLNIIGSSNRNTRQDNLSVSSSKVFIPVRPGTDLKSFDPELIPSFGATISPEGPQDFTNENGVKYTVTNGSTSKEFTVTAAVHANPVLPGFTADPEVLYSRKTGRFYIYPTSDGYPGWGGYKFNVYSSADLVDWTLEECILDLSGDDVIWATGNAWAPCIEEKYENGEYRYYFYFSGHNPDKNYKTLGCAVSDSPTGPFVDLGHPMLDTNLASGQLIDSDVFTDPVSGDSFFYWGNGYLAASRLSPTMTEVSDARVITPAGGTTANYAFREGVYVFYRKGIYYFLWSVDDTGAKNYHVAYGTATSPLGPITVAKDPIVIKQDAKNSIYGTGHNSILQIPDRDEWYIVYHRINKKFVSNNPGYHREVCIDKLEFNEDGTIKQTTPTHTGVGPVSLEDISGVQDTFSDIISSPVVSVEYYDLAGHRLGKAPVAKGIYLKTETHADGSRTSTKFAF